MKRILLIILPILLSEIAISQVVLTSSNLPIVVINTGGQIIVDETKITCDMGIIYNGPGVYNFITDPFNNYDGKIGIEIRGSTSQQYPKKSYGVETRDSSGANLNVPLLGMPSENDWVLYGAYPDKTLMREEITSYLFARMQPWSPRYVYCELVINGQYKGVYTLKERIKRDNNRIDIARLDPDDNAGDSLTGGYIIKVDKPTGSSPTSWTSPYQYKLEFLFHDPEDIELTVQQQAYIQDYVTDFENVVYGPNFTDPTIGYAAYINTESFIDFYLMQELGRTVDGYRSSSFMYKDKDSKDGKLSCGPMWDFNLSYGNADYCDAYDTTGWQYNFATVCPGFTSEPPNWWARLVEDTNYNNKARCRWEYLRSTILNTDSVDAWIDQTATYLNESQQRNFTRWPIIGVYVNWNYFVGQSWQEEIDYLKYWFKARSEYMDNHLPGFCDHSDIADNNFSSVKINIAPNPFVQSTVVSFDGSLPGEKFISILDLLGHSVMHVPIPENQSSVLIERNGLSSGLYFYCFIADDRVVATGKLIIID